MSAENEMILPWLDELKYHIQGITTSPQIMPKMPPMKSDAKNAENGRHIYEHVQGMKILLLRKQEGDPESGVEHEMDSG